MQDAKLEPAPLSGLGSRRMRSSMERQAAGAARAQIGLRAGQPPHVARALALQRTAGNRAVAALAHRTLTRRVLDQADPLAAWRQLTPSGLFTTRGSENPELLHIDALLGRLQFSGPGGNEVVRKKDVLLRLRLVLDQWLVRGQREQTLKDRRDALVLLREEVNAQIAGETSVDWIDESWGGYAAPTHAIDPGRNAFDEYVEKGGMPADLKQTFLDDYKRIRALLTDKVTLRRLFAILEQRMEEGSSLSGALKSFETALGFARPSTGTRSRRRAGPMGATRRSLAAIRPLPCWCATADQKSAPPRSTWPSATSCRRDSWSASSELKRGR
jgi:hypothetical protein